MEVEKMSEDKKEYTGTVIWFQAKPGIGFITFEPGNDIFVHFSDIISEGFKTLKKDQIVSFNIGQNNEGRPKAINVTIIEDV